MADECTCSSLHRVAGALCSTCFQKLIDESQPALRVLEEEMRTIQMNIIRAEKLEKEGI